MSKTLCIYGAGGFAKEVYWLAHQCGFTVEAFIDLHEGGSYNATPIKDESYFDSNKHLAVVAVGSPRMREKIVKQIIDKHGVNVFQTLIHPRANIMAPNVLVGIGSVICANCILTCDVKLGNFSQLNLATTIGHDVKTGNFFTTAPGVHISGKVTTGNRVYFGTNSSTVEEITITDDVTIGASACVSKDILQPGIYVGVPAKKLEKKNG